MEDKDYAEYISSVFDLNNISILTGTGLAKACGGKSMAEVANDLIEHLNLFTDDADINFWKDRYLDIKTPNFEKFLNALITKKKYLDSISKSDDSLDSVILDSKQIVFDACNYTPNQMQSKSLFKFLSALSMRKAGLSRPYLFTLNYDLIQETAADNLGITLIDGFSGSANQNFNPVNFDKDLYYPSGVLGQHPVRCENVVNYLKIHGSINWSSHDGQISKVSPNSNNMIIYPSYDKLNDTLLDPFNELLKRFNDAIKRPKSSLIIVGYGFGDSHINRMILQALQSPSFILINVNPNQDLIFNEIPKAKQYEHKITNIASYFDEFVDNHISLQDISTDSSDKVIDAFLKRLSSHATRD